MHRIFATDDWIQISFLLALILIVATLVLEIREIYRIVTDPEYQPDSFIMKIQKISKKSSVGVRGLVAAINVVSSLLLLFGLLVWNSNYNLFWIFISFISIPLNLLLWAIFDKSTKNLTPIAISTLQLVVVGHVTMIIAATNFKIF